jgi:hypothetical protein
VKRRRGLLHLSRVECFTPDRLGQLQFDSAVRWLALAAAIRVVQLSSEKSSRPIGIVEFAGPVPNV